uniref:Uncharacterized protein n=1 Tax=Anguilla anguilla TaxID=7936 RepID=A0A0E9RSS5_ANGAN
MMIYWHLLTYCILCRASGKSQRVEQFVSLP